MTAEQLSASVSTAGQRISAWYSQLSPKRIQQLLCLLLLLWLLYGLVQLILTLIPSSLPSEASSAAATTASEEQTTGGRSIDVTSLQALHLFGEAGAQQPTQEQVAPVQEDIDAEKTRLNLTLEGIVYSSTQEESAAAIVHGGRQEFFLVGDKIPVGNNVSLDRVMLDRVILNNNGNLESLWLFDEEKAQAQSSSSRSARAPARASQERVADHRKNNRITNMAENYRDRLMKNPTSLAQVIRITPAQVEGQMVGYRVSPGKDREQFKALGLKANDIVTSINGIELTEPSNALEVYKLMRTATEVSFTLDRNGEPIEIMVSLGG